MNEPYISPDFTVDDIHKVREYNHETTNGMSKEDRRNYYKAGALEAQKRIDELRIAKKNGIV